MLRRKRKCNCESCRLCKARARSERNRIRKLQKDSVSDWELEERLIRKFKERGWD